MNQTNSKPDLYQAVTDQVLELMETHGSDWTKPWTGSGIPQNALTKAEYQGRANASIRPNIRGI